MGLDLLSQSLLNLKPDGCSTITFEHSNYVGIPAKFLVGMHFQTDAGRKYVNGSGDSIPLAFSQADEKRTASIRDNAFRVSAAAAEFGPHFPTVSA